MPKEKLQHLHLDLFRVSLTFYAIHTATGLDFSRKMQGFNYSPKEVPIAGPKQEVVLLSLVTIAM